MNNKDSFEKPDSTQIFTWCRHSNYQCNSEIYQINTVLCKNNQWLKIEIITKDFPVVFFKTSWAWKEYLHPSKRNLIKQIPVDIYKYNFIECYCEEVGDGGVIPSPTSSSPYCWLMVWMNSCLERGLWYTFNRCPFTTKAVCSSTIVLILTEPL